MRVDRCTFRNTFDNIIIFFLLQATDLFLLIEEKISRILANRELSLLSAIEAIQRR